MPAVWLAIRLGWMPQKTASRDANLVWSLQSIPGYVAVSSRTPACWQRHWRAGPERSSMLSLLEHVDKCISIPQWVACETHEEPFRGGPLLAGSTNGPVHLKPLCKSGPL